VDILHYLVHGCAWQDAAEYCQNGVKWWKYLPIKGYTAFNAYIGIRKSLILRFIIFDNINQFRIR